MRGLPGPGILIVEVRDSVAVSGVIVVIGVAPVIVMVEVSV